VLDCGITISDTETHSKLVFSVPSMSPFSKKLSRYSFFFNFTFLLFMERLLFVVEKEKSLCLEIKLFG
jgi:hypothetical protein